MKKTPLQLSILFVSIIALSTTSFAQEVPGGAGDGSSIESSETSANGSAQPLGIHFTRNNGDGTCGGQAQIRLHYNSAPTVSPLLTEIIYQGEPLYTNYVPIKGDIVNFASKGYVSFCLPTSNIPPAVKLTLTYKPSESSQSASISGTN